MLRSAERSQLAIQYAQRFPFAFGMQFFFSIVGIVSLTEYLSETYFGGVASVTGARVFVTAALGAVLFTRLMRRNRGAAPPDKPTLD